MINEKFYTPKQACELLGVHIRTLQDWDNKGVINVVRTPGNRRRIPQSEIDKLLKKNSKTAIIYARALSYDEKKEGVLDKQVESIMSKLNISDYSSVKTITDIGSSLDEKRNGLIELMRLSKNRKIDTIYIWDKNILTQVGFNYLEAYFNAYDVKVVVVNDSIQNDNVDIIDEVTLITLDLCKEIYSLESKKNVDMKKRIKSILEKNF